MPLELQIIRAREFVRLGASNRLDLTASKSALAALALACSKRGIDQALLDLREVQPAPTPVFTPADLAELVGNFQEMGFQKNQRIAVLYTADPHRRARLFAMIGSLRGWHVAAFDSFENALLWLAGEETVDLQSCANEESVAIRKPIS